MNEHYDLKTREIKQREDKANEMATRALVIAGMIAVVLTMCANGV